MGDGPLDEEESAKPALEHGRSEECLLVVEDDDDVRGYTVELLREIGYRVLEAHDGPSALRLLERQDAPIPLLFTDAVMPGMSGRELAEHAHSEERRVGQEGVGPCRCRWAPLLKKKKNK